MHKVTRFISSSSAAAGTTVAKKLSFPTHSHPMHYILIPSSSQWSLRNYENGALLAYWFKSGDISLPQQNQPRTNFPDFRKTANLTFPFLMPSTGASFIKCGILQSPVSPPPVPVLMAYNIKSGIIVRDDQLPERLVFSHLLPVFKDVVVTYYRDETGPSVSVHGIWFNNVIKRKLVTLRNQKHEDPAGNQFMYERIIRMLLRKDPEEVEDSIWAPPEGGGMYQLQAYQYVTHNIYGGQPFMPDYLTAVPLIASPFVDTILPFIRTFEMVLAKYIKENCLAKDESALDLCSRLAKKFYGKKVRIAVKETSKAKKKVEFGFLVGPEENLVDHVGKNRYNDVLKF